ncbi:MAG: S8 family serine peptidase [Kineosporiaceae bacterium]|nr:S8 family serine peptidase [Aeromicrobium sp.]
MKRIIFLVSLALATTVMSAPAAQAEPPVPAWAQQASSLNLSPAAIVAKAPKGKPLKVVITRRTANGPVIDSSMESSAADAKRLIASAQGKDSTIGIDMAQPVHMAVTNDTYRSRQWALTTLRAEPAWKFSVGTGVTVAVVDTGVQSNHPDLAGKVLKGYDALAKGTSAADENGHGTHVAGIIAAIANNGRGVAGLTRGTRILPVRVLDAQGGGDTAGVAQGIVWATNHGAQVINMSLAARLSDSATRSAVAYAISRNVVVVAAAGNDGCELFGSPPSYPAAYPGVIGVGSIDSGNAKSRFSDCGSWVDVTAPGGGIWSTMIRNSNPKLDCGRTAYYCELAGPHRFTHFLESADARDDCQRSGCRDRSPDVG